MQDICRKIGILGGTFNPIHCGHLIIAEAVREKFSLEKVLFIPTGIPPHKTDSSVAGAEHRFDMVYCAVRSNPYFEASRMEIDRLGLTYTIDTLARIKTVYGNDTAIYFIVGADVIPELVTWKDYTRVFGMCEFIAVLRPGRDGETFLKDMDSLKSQYPVVIHVAEAPLIDISSTGIRGCIKTGRSIKYLVPQCVEDYICEKGLYKG